MMIGEPPRGRVDLPRYIDGSALTGYGLGVGCGPADNKLIDADVARKYAFAYIWHILY